MHSGTFVVWNGVFCGILILANMYEASFAKLLVFIFCHYIMYYY